MVDSRRSRRIGSAVGVPAAQVGVACGRLGDAEDTAGILVRRVVADSSEEDTADARSADHPAVDEASRPEAGLPESVEHKSAL